jgi:hypothetical protein
LARLLLHFEFLKAAQYAPPWLKREMTGRKKDDGWIWLVAEVVGVLLLFGLIWPQSRQMICAVGVPAVGAISIAGTGLIGFGIYRFVTRAQ